MMGVTTYNKTRFNQLKDWLKTQSIPEHDDWLITSILSNDPYVSEKESDEEWFVIAYAPNDEVDNYGIFQIYFSKQLFDSPIAFDKCHIAVEGDENKGRYFIEPIHAGQQVLKDI